MTVPLRMGLVQRGAALPCPAFPYSVYLIPPQFCSQEASRLEKEYEASLTKSTKEENLSLQKLIKDITEVSRELGPHPCKLDLTVLEEGNRLAQGIDRYVVYCPR